MRVRRLVLSASLALCLLTGGCWDRVEIEDVAWVQAMGFDKGPDGFLATTFEIGIPHGLPGGGHGGAEGPHYTTITVVSKTALDAIDLVAVNLGRRVSLEHTRIFVFGEDLAKDDLRALAGAMGRFRQIRGASLVAIARGRAEDVLRITCSPLESSPSRFIQTILQQEGHTGLFKYARFVEDFLNNMESSSQDPVAPVIAVAYDYLSRSKESGGGGGSQSLGPEAKPGPTPEIGERVEPEGLPPAILSPEGGATEGIAGEIPKIGGGTVTLMGTAVFSDGVLVGYLTGEETRALLMIQGHFARAAFSVPDPQVPHEPQYSMSVDVRGGSSKVRATRDGDKVKITIEGEFDVSYMSMKTQTDYTDPKYSPLAESAIASYLKEVMDRAIQKAQAFGADPFGLGNKVRRTFTTWPEFESFAWKTKFASAEIATSVDIHLRRYGMSLGPLHVPISETIP